MLVSDRNEGGDKMKILVTGAAGFIGYSLCMHLLRRGDTVTGIDNLNDYYDVGLKESRLARLRLFSNFAYQAIDVADRVAMAKLFTDSRFEVIAHLAAQAGVRYSLVNPAPYIDTNLVGFANVLEGARQLKIAHLVYASSSSVYGANTRLPFSEHHNVDHPISLYAATKKANELMAHSYAHLFGIPCTGLRFFTVYGPWGRPDMALFKFTDGILKGIPIPVYNGGKMVRDFTYIDDIVDGIMGVIDRPAACNVEFDTDMPDPGTSFAPYRIYNIGNNQPVELMRYIEVLEQCLGRKAQLQMLPMQPGDVQATMADVTELDYAVGLRRRTSVEEGIAKFVEWYRDYYGVVHDPAPSIGSA
jgi:UDP-glucuronate 4-epimerase